MTEAADLLAELRRFAERFPIPHPLWHRYVPQIHEVVVDLTAALDAIASLPSAQEQLLHRVAAEADAPPDDAGGPAVAAARARLRELPIPAGEHPYLDEIRPTLEAAELALAALAAADGGGAAFPASRSRLAAP